MHSKIIAISLPPDLIKILDAAAIADFTSSSGYIRKAVLQKIEDDKGRREELDRLLKVRAPQPIAPEQSEVDMEFLKKLGFADYEEYVKEVNGPRF
jgi:hypothetical protein